MNAAIFLDRDNTLINNDGDLGDPQGVRLLQGVASALASLRGLGYRLVVVTNQGGVARGKYTEEDVDKVNARISELVRSTSGAVIDAFYFCPFHPQGTVEKYRKEHAWRKPAPGMLLQAAKDLKLDLALSWMVGDQMRDVEAGLAAGVRTILLSPDAEVLTPLQLEQIAAGDSVAAQAIRPHFRAKSLVEAVRIIAQQRTPDDVRIRQRAQGDGGKSETLASGLFAGVVGDMATQPAPPAVATVLPTPKSSSTRNIRPPSSYPQPVNPSASPVLPSVSSRATPPAPAATPAAPAPQAKAPAKPPATSSLLGGMTIEDDEPDEGDELKGAMAPVGNTAATAPPTPPAAPTPSSSLLGGVTIEDDEPDEGDELKGSMAPVGTRAGSNELLGDVIIEDDEPDESDMLKGAMAPISAGAPAAKPSQPPEPPKPAPVAKAPPPPAPLKPAPLPPPKQAVPPPPAVPPMRSAPAAAAPMSTPVPPAPAAAAPRPMPPVTPPRAPLQPAVPPTPLPPRQAPVPPATPAASAVTSTPAAPPAPPAAAPIAPPPAATAAPVPAPVSATPPASAAPSVPVPPSAPAAVPPPTPPAPAPVSAVQPRPAAPPAMASEDVARLEAALREILREIRSHRGVQDDFSVLAVIAIVLQMVTVVCFLVALVIGRGEGGHFERWIFSAILLQLMTLATLKFKEK